MIPPSVPNPAPAPLATCTITTDSGPVVVPCEPISDALAITPAFGMDEHGKTMLGGNFLITHLPSGRHISDGPGCINCCRSAGRALMELGIDWSAADAENIDALIKSWSPELLRAVAEARTVAWSCDADYCAPWPSAEQVA